MLVVCCPECRSTKSFKCSFTFIPGTDPIVYFKPPGDCLRTCLACAAEFCCPSELCETCSGNVNCISLPPARIEDRDEE